MSDKAGLASLIATGTKLYLDSVDPDLVRANRALGAVGATSNPIIIADLVKTGRFDDRIRALTAEGKSAAETAWAITDELVRDAQGVFLPVWEETRGDDGWVSFELDPLLEDSACPLSHPEKVAEYVRLAKHWSAGHKNRMIKVPATPAGLDAIGGIVAAGVAVNVTLIFSARQYDLARDAAFGAAASAPGGLEAFKSVYSIFVSRIDVYTEKLYPQLSADAQGQVGIVNAKRLWRRHRAYCETRPTPRAQEIIFASTGTKKPADAPWKYVAAFAGSDIQTNPPATNDAVHKSGRAFDRQVQELPADAVLAEIDRTVDFARMETDLMAEGLAKFADPQKALLALIASKR